MVVWERYRAALRETPWTLSLVTGAFLVWVAAFFSFDAPMRLLGGELDLLHAWRWVTYPLANPVPPSGFLWLALGLWVFTLFAGPLERSWGSLRFARVLLVLTLLSALGDWLAAALVSRSFPPLGASVAGLQGPAGAIFMIWAAYHRQATVLFMFVIPVQAGFLAMATVVLTFFSRGLTFGPPAALLMLGAWFWASRQSLTPSRSSGPTRGLSQWWADRQKARRKGRFQLLEGGSTLASPPRFAALQSTTPPPPKVDDAAEKELDRILDKIRFEGMAALTEAERATLDSQSRRLRGDA